MSSTLLANYGFKQGDEFKVSCLEEGKIVLEKISNELDCLGIVAHYGPRRPVKRGDVDRSGIAVLMMF
jgi:hypothetical protein